MPSTGTGSAPDCSRPASGIGSPRPSTISSASRIPSTTTPSSGETPNASRTRSPPCSEVDSTSGSSSSTRRAPTAATNASGASPWTPSTPPFAGPARAGASSRPSPSRFPRRPRRISSRVGSPPSPGLKRGSRPSRRRTTSARHGRTRDSDSKACARSRAVATTRSFSPNGRRSVASSAPGSRFRPARSPATRRRRSRRPPGWALPSRSRRRDADSATSRRRGRFGSGPKRRTRSKRPPAPFFRSVKAFSSNAW